MSSAVGHTILPKSIRGQEQGRSDRRVGVSRTASAIRPSFFKESSRGMSIIRKRAVYSHRKRIGRSASNDPHGGVPVGKGREFPFLDRPYR